VVYHYDEDLLVGMTVIGVKAAFGSGFDGEQFGPELTAEGFSRPLAEGCRRLTADVTLSSPGSWACWWGCLGREHF